MSSSTDNVLKYAINDAMDVMQARRGGMDMALTLGFSQAESTKIAVVISELGRNIVNYAGAGQITVIASHTVMGRAYVKIVAEDHGPGIADLDAVLAGGLSSSGGLGLGISGSRRMMDEFDIQTAVGKGTRIQTLKWLT